MYFGKKINGETVNDYSILPRILGRPEGLLTQIFDSACTFKKKSICFDKLFSFVPCILG